MKQAGEFIPNRCDGILQTLISTPLQYGSVSQSTKNKLIGHSKQPRKGWYVFNIEYLTKSSTKTGAKLDV